MHILNIPFSLGAGLYIVQSSGTCVQTEGCLYFIWKNEDLSCNFGREEGRFEFLFYQEEGRFELEWIDTANAWYAERQRRSKSSQSTHLLYKAIQVRSRFTVSFTVLNLLFIDLSGFVLTRDIY